MMWVWKIHSTLNSSLQSAKTSRPTTSQEKITPSSRAEHYSCYDPDQLPAENQRAGKMIKTVSTHSKEHVFLFTYMTWQIKMTSIERKCLVDKIKWLQLCRVDKFYCVSYTRHSKICICLPNITVENEFHEVHRRKMLKLNFVCFSCKWFIQFQIQRWAAFKYRSVERKIKWTLCIDPTYTWILLISVSETE